MTIFLMVVFGLVGGALGYALHNGGRLRIAQWQAVAVGAAGGVLGGLLIKYVLLLLTAIIGALVLLALFSRGSRG